jgi:hypothetical protein
MRPEEEVRQKLLQKMRLDLGFPEAMLAVERQIGKIPHLLGKKVPDRRFDVVAFAKNIHPLHSIFPLLLIECKAHRVASQDFEQAMGYNAYILSPFVAMASKEGEMLAWKIGGEYRFYEGLFSYNLLIEMAQREGMSG